MPTMQAAAQDHLARESIAVAGVSSTADDAANPMRELRSGGRRVLAVYPKAQTLAGGDPIPAGVVLGPGAVPRGRSLLVFANVKGRG